MVPAMRLTARLYTNKFVIVLGLTELSFPNVFVTILLYISITILSLNLILQKECRLATASVKINA